MSESKLRAADIMDAVHDILLKTGVTCSTH